MRRIPFRKSKANSHRPSLPPLGEVPRSGKGGAVGDFELLPFIEPHPLSQPCRFRSAVKSASSPNGEPSLTSPERGGGPRVSVAEGFAVRRIPFRKSKANSYRPSLPPLGEVPRSGKGGVVGNFELLPFIEPHPLSQAVWPASSPIGEPRVARGEVCGTRNTNQKTKANSCDLRADSPFCVERNAPPVSLRGCISFA